jgi:uncharacterized protein YsxB (DUF464 family)
MGKTKRDYFIFTDIEVSGHAETLNLNHTTGIKICAGISACCYGIRRLIDDDQFKMDIKKGYFHVWTNIRTDLRANLDRDSVHALNTLVCQLYEIYCEYPMAFKSFELVDVKEKIEDERKQRNNEQWNEREPRRKKNLQGVGFCSLIEKTHH